MNLYLLRHAMALDRSQWKKADSERPLTQEGIRKMKKAAKGMRRLGIPLDWLLTSPYRRAYDTAQIVAKEFKAKKKLKVTKMLASDGDPKALIRHLGLNFRPWESILLVGHEPYLGQLISMLATGTKNINFELHKGGLAKLAIEVITYDRCARLEWLLTPKLLKRLV